MPPFFRQANIKDIDEIQMLARRIWDEAYSEILTKDQIDYMLEMMYSGKAITEELVGDVVWEVIVADGKLCGYLSYGPSEDNSVKLSKIYIDKGFRGKSIASDAIKRVIRYAVLNGKDYIFLSVNKNNKRAIRAYENNGFAIAASAVKDIGCGFVMDDYIMKYLVKTRGK
jgi:ribosomal protein S18 acetylase RimI-like enzyme